MVQWFWNLTTKKPRKLLGFLILRRERDSNPRTFWVNGFQDRRIRPLCHLSAAKIASERRLKNFSDYFIFWKRCYSRKDFWIIVPDGVNIRRLELFLSASSNFAVNSLFETATGTQQIFLEIPYPPWRRPLIRFSFQLFQRPHATGNRLHHWFCTTFIEIAGLPA